MAYDITFASQHNIQTIIDWISKSHFQGQTFVVAQNCRKYLVLCALVITKIQINNNLSHKSVLEVLNSKIKNIGFHKLTGYSTYLILKLHYQKMSNHHYTYEDEFGQIYFLKPYILSKLEIENGRVNHFFENLEGVDYLLKMEAPIQENSMSLIIFIYSKIINSLEAKSKMLSGKLRRIEGLHGQFSSFKKKNLRESIIETILDSDESSVLDANGLFSIVSIGVNKSIHSSHIVTRPYITPKLSNWGSSDIQDNFPKTKSPNVESLSTSLSLVNQTILTKWVLESIKQPNYDVRKFRLKSVNLILVISSDTIVLEKEHSIDQFLSSGLNIIFQVNSVKRRFQFIKLVS